MENGAEAPKKFNSMLNEETVLEAVVLLVVKRNKI